MSYLSFEFHTSQPLRWSYFLAGLFLIPLKGTLFHIINVHFSEIAKKEEIIKENKEKVEERLQDLANLQDLEMTTRTEK